jgi:phosphatidate cytidylyltransferase
MTSPGRTAALRTRVVSALVLVPPVLVAVYFGPPYTDLLIMAGGAVLAWEWARLCGGRPLGPPGFATMAAVVVALAAGAIGLYAVAGWLIAAGAMGALVLALRAESPRSAWYALGVIYAAVPCLALMWLRQDPEVGLAVTLWILTLVWATDTGAYFAGRLVGGPKLAPVISPKKTWSGLLGGMIAAALVGIGAAALREDWAPGALAAASVVLAVVAQGGDLLESGIKRHFGVKDTSGLIPGHGGLMDRVDGLLTVSIAVASVVRLQGAFG